MMKKIVMILITGLATALFATGSIAAEIMGVDIHGFLSQGYLAATDNDFSSDTEDDNFAFNEVGLSFSKDLSDNMRIGTQLFARDFGDVGNNAIIVDWAFADYRFQEWLGFRFGQIKTPHGLYNETRDVDMLRNAVFLPESVYQELSHDVYFNDVYLSLQGISSRDLYLSIQGLSVYGYLDLDMAGEFSYQFVYGTQSVETDNKIGQRQLELFSRSTLNMLPIDSIENDSFEVDYKYAGNVIWDTPFTGLRLGASLDNINMTIQTRVTKDIYGPDLTNPTGPPIIYVNAGDIARVDYKKMQNWVLSAEYTWDNLILMSELMKTNKEYDITPVGGFPPTVLESNPWGWYVGGAYRFTDWFELGGIYSQSRDEDREKLTGLPSPDFFLELDDMVLTTRFDINEYWCVKLEAHKLRGVYELPEGSLLAPTYREIEENWSTFIAKMTVTF